MFRRFTVAAFLTCQAGFSAAETTTVIAATSILSATAAPQIQDYLEQARTVKASGDVRVIAISIIRLASHVIRLEGPRGDPPMLLVSEGEAPQAAEAAAVPWTAEIDDRATQRLDAHLTDNTVGYTTDPLHPRRWRGPYVERLSADPWGSRYAVNIGLLSAGGGRTVLVVSPGPNRVIDTPFDSVGLRQIGDDVIALIGRGR